MPDRKDFDEFLDNRVKEQRKEQIPHLKMASQAAVSAEQLTGHPAWDRYLQTIKALIGAAEGHREMWSEILHDPKVVNIDAIIKAKIGYAECNSRAQAWKAVLDLPAEIMAAGKQAKEALGKIDEQT